MVLESRGFMRLITDQISTLGLEKATPLEAKKRELFRLNSWLAVLNEQDKQKSKGKCNPERIAKKYREAISLREGESRQSDDSE